MAKAIIAVLNQKGGVGKTTTTINLAAYLAKQGRRVVIADFDPQGNATSGLGIDKSALTTTLYDVLMGEAQIADISIETHIDGLSVLPSNPNLAAAEVDLVQVKGRELLGRKALEHIDADYIFIDCPPSLGLLSINALSAATHIIVPVQAEYYALEGLGQLMGVVQRVKQALNTNLTLLGVLITMYDSRTALAEQVKNELEKHFEQKVFKTNIPRNVRLAEAPSFGRTIMEHDKWSKGARAYKQLTKEVMKRVEG
jgi:chromosome partitioning protein